MGSIVKSIGKAISKIGKGLKKVIKKIGPTLLLAAAVYVGVAFMGAGGIAGGVGSLSPANFMKGLTVIQDKVMGFISPSASGAAAGATQAAAGGAATATQMAAGPMSYLQAGATVPGTPLMTAASAAAQGAATTTAAAGASTVSSFVSAAANPGMTTGDALIYMTKMNMLQTGVQMVAGFFDKTEEEQREHEKELLSMKYSYGKPSSDAQREWLQANPNWIQEHPAQQQQQVDWGMSGLAQGSAAQSPFVQAQTMGEPTFGRQGTRQFETTSPTALASKGPGMISQGTQQYQLPKRQPRRFA